MGRGRKSWPLSWQKWGGRYVDEETGLTIGADFYPKEEAPIKASRPGWAEQNPEDWWSYVKIAMKGAMSKAKVKGEDIKYLVPDAWLGGGGQEDGGASSIYYLVR